MSDSDFRIMVVDDDRDMLESVTEVLQRLGYSVEAVSSAEDCLKKFDSGMHDVIVSDVKMPGMTGIELMDEIKKRDPGVPFVVMTAYGDINMAVSAMKKGAYDFLEKGGNLIDELEFAVDRAVKHRALASENQKLRDQLAKEWKYIGNTERISKIREIVASIADSRSTVLITGESGTGKELVARSIHAMSPRNNNTFVKLNCAAMPEGLIESELFGHEKGAFTGALKSRQGKFELASGGTLLLDEIGEMPMEMQAKLLRVLQEREVNKVGGDEPVKVDVRIIATTNRDLYKEIEEGKFREDLFYRLNVFSVDLPPLRSRKSDIPLLVDHFIKKYNAENGYTVEGVKDDVYDKLKGMDWPGNIRELENVIERAVVLTRNDYIDSDAITDNIAGRNGKDGLNPGMTVADAERKLIHSTLDYCSGNRTKAAEMLGISIRTLRNKLNEYSGESG